MIASIKNISAFSRSIFFLLAITVIISGCTTTSPFELHSVPVNGLAQQPPMGWDSWNNFHTRIDDKLVREIADAMVISGMEKAGYKFIIVDDGWEGTRDVRGNFHSNERFPNMIALASYIHSKGLKFGIYSSPGPRTCDDFEGSYGHEKQDALTFAAWGVDYLKYDWCTAKLVYKLQQQRAIFQKMGEALQATGHPIIYSLSQRKSDVEHWGTAVGGNLWRTTGDIRDDWDKMSEIGFEKQLGLESFAGPGHWNDPDMLEVGNGGMTDDEYRTQMSLWAMLAAPLIAGNDLRNMSNATHNILTNPEVIAIDQDPLGQQGRQALKLGDSEVWIRTLEDGNKAVAFFNRGNQLTKITVRWFSLGISGKYRVRDLWKHIACDAIAAHGYTADVAPHGVVILRLIPLSSH